MLRVVPIDIKTLNWLVELYHRHNGPIRGHKFSLGVVDNCGNYVAACSVGRPINKVYDPDRVLEITRLVTTGHKNACSILYGRVAKIAQLMGYERVQTYILESEPGTSLKAAGWRYEETTQSTSSTWVRPRKEFFHTPTPTGRKQRWVKDLQASDGRRNREERRRGRKVR